MRREAASLARHRTGRFFANGLRSVGYGRVATIQSETLFAFEEGAADGRAVLRRLPEGVPRLRAAGVKADLARLLTARALDPAVCAPGVADDADARGG